MNLRILSDEEFKNLDPNTDVVYLPSGADTNAIKGKVVGTPKPHDDYVWICNLEKLGDPKEIVSPPVVKSWIGQTAIEIVHTQ